MNAMTHRVRRAASPSPSPSPSSSPPAGGRTVAGIRDAQITAVLRERRRRHAGSPRSQRPIGKLDRLISECEELHLDGLTRVPAAMGPHLRELAAEFPSSAPGLLAAATLTELIDELFSLQEGLLGSRREGPGEAGPPGLARPPHAGSDVRSGGGRGLRGDAEPTDAF